MGDDLAARRQARSNGQATEEGFRRCPNCGNAWHKLIGLVVLDVAGMITGYSGLVTCGECGTAITSGPPQPADT